MFRLLIVIASLGGVAGLAASDPLDRASVPAQAGRLVLPAQPARSPLGNRAANLRKAKAALRKRALQGKKPNILIILSDDQGYHDVGFQGVEDIPTPYIDSI